MNSCGAFSLEFAGSAPASLPVRKAGAYLNAEKVGATFYRTAKSRAAGKRRSEYAFG
jgi:hypothetical protein